MYRPVLEDKSWTRNVWEAIGSNWRARWDEERAKLWLSRGAQPSTTVRKLLKIQGIEAPKR